MFFGFVVVTAVFADLAGAECVPVSKLTGSQLGQSHAEFIKPFHRGLVGELFVPEQQTSFFASFGELDGCVVTELIRIDLEHSSDRLLERTGTFFCG